MRNPRWAAVAALGAFSISFSSMLTILSGTASADTGACTSYLEDQGEDTTARYHICVDTEAIADAVSGEYAQEFCVPEMESTRLPSDLSTEACRLAVAP